MDKEELFKHELVPKHEILSVKDKEALLKKLKISAENLPKIHDSDAVVKIIEAKAGDVIKITRKSQTAGIAIYYRLVINTG